MHDNRPYLVNTLVMPVLSPSAVLVGLGTRGKGEWQLGLHMGHEAIEVRDQLAHAA